MDSDIFEIKKCSLTALSPIHIGSFEQRLTPFEYIYGYERIFFISDEKLSHFLLKKNLIEPYVKTISIEGHKFRLSSFFREKGVILTEQDLIEISGGRYAKAEGDITRLQDFRPIIRDGIGEVFIPGTSIKGVIKTAVLFEVLKKLKEQDENAFKYLVENRISDDISKGEKKKFFFQWGMEKWFEAFELNNKRNSSNTDWFRMLHVTDAYPVEEIKTSILPISIIKKEHIGWAFKTESHGINTLIWAECIPEGTVFEFEISWDRRLLESFKKENDNTSLPENLDNLMSALKNWSNSTKAFEEEFSSDHPLQDWYKNKQPNFRIGFGSGMVSTTIIQLLTDDLKKRVRNYAGLDRGDDVAPKSRRVWVNDNQLIPLGWANLESLPFDTRKGLFSRMPERRSMILITENQKDKQLEKTIVEKPIEKKKPENIKVEGVTLIYSPSNKSLTTTVEGKKAFVEHIDDSFVPEHLWPKLKKHKTMKASILVEPVGNAFRIVKIIGE